MIGRRIHARHFMSNEYCQSQTFDTLIRKSTRLADSCPSLHVVRILPVANFQFFGQSEGYVHQLRMLYIVQHLPFLECNQIRASLVVK